MRQKRPSLFGALFTLILVGGTLFWWVNSLTNEDPLWFLRIFRSRAAWIIVYWEGETHMFFPGDPGYDPIMDAFADGVAHWQGYEHGVGLSDENLMQYRNQECFLELHYNKPVQVHTRFLYPEARNFFVPLSGTHAEYHRIFAGLTDVPRIGVLNMSGSRYETLIETVEAALENHLAHEH